MRSNIFETPKTIKELCSCRTRLPGQLAKVQDPSLDRYVGHPFIIVTISLCAEKQRDEFSQKRFRHITSFLKNDSVTLWVFSKTIQKHYEFSLNYSVTLWVFSKTIQKHYEFSQKRFSDTMGFLKNDSETLRVFFKLFSDTMGFLKNYSETLRVFSKTIQ